MRAQIDQLKRWEEARKKRIARGLPADPTEPDPAYLEAMLMNFKNQMTRKVVPQKSFHPDLEGEGAELKGGVKNYIVIDKYGRDRDYRPPWRDPNPVKYGGKYGMQNMKEMLSTGY